MAAWTDNEVGLLISLWGDSTIQAELEGCKKNRDVYERIAKKMREAGFDRTGVQCRDKIKKLKGDYRKVKDHNNQTGNNRKTFRFYDAMNAIMGDKPTTTPPVMIDTSLESSFQSQSETDGHEADESNREGDSNEELQMEKKGKEAEKKGESTDTADTATGPELAYDEKLDEKDKKAGGKEVKAEKPPSQKRKKKEESKKDKVERMLDKFCETIGKSQQESDRLFISLEEKRIKLDHDLMEMERQRQREESERLEMRRREDREFQLKLFSMMCQGQGMQRSTGAMPYGMPSYSSYPPGEATWPSYGSTEDTIGSSDQWKPPQ